MAKSKIYDIDINAIAKEMAAAGDLIKTAAPKKKKKKNSAQQKQVLCEYEISIKKYLPGKTVQISAIDASGVTRTFTMLEKNVNETHAKVILLSNNFLIFHSDELYKPFLANESLLHDIN